MADTAFQTQYRQEFIAGFESRKSLLTETVTTEVVIKGNTATFLVADSGNAEAVTRGVTGLIPARADNLTQLSATLVEWHDLVRKTDFNVFASQGNQREIMQMTTMGVLNRKIDSDIITMLNTGTVNTGAAVTGTVGLILKATTILQNSEVPWDGNVFGLMTPAMYAYAAQTKEFASKEYITLPRFENTELWKDMPRMFRWLEVNWLVHPRLPGKGTNAEKCFIYHKSAAGHAVDTENLETPVGYNEEQAYSWARASGKLGSKVLQNSGIVVINHDGSAYVAA